MAQRKAPLGAGLVVLSTMFYATYGVWTRLMGHYFAPFVQATIRHIITCSILFCFAVALRQLKKVHWVRDARWLAMSAITSAIIPVCMYYAYLGAGVGISQALLFMGIMIGMFVSGWLFAKERYTKDKWLATIVGTFGIWLVFAPNLGGGNFIALLLAFVGGAASGVNIVASKKLPYGALQTALLAWFLGIFANLPFIFIFREPLASPFHFHVEWLYLVIFGMLSVGATWLMISGVKLIEAGAAGILQLFEIVFGVVFGIFLFGERPSKIVGAGILLIMVAAFIPTLKDLNIKRGTLEASKS